MTLFGVFNGMSQKEKSMDTCIQYVLYIRKQRRKPSQISYLGARNGHEQREKSGQKAPNYRYYQGYP